MKKKSSIISLHYQWISWFPSQNCINYQPINLKLHHQLRETNGFTGSGPVSWCTIANPATMISCLTAVLWHALPWCCRPVLDTATVWVRIPQRPTVHALLRNTRDSTEGNAVIEKHASREIGHVHVVRGYENDEYLKESSIERILDHDYNPRERVVYWKPPTSGLQGKPGLQEKDTEIMILRVLWWVEGCLDFYKNFRDFISFQFYLSELYRIWKIFFFYYFII